MKSGSMLHKTELSTFIKSWRRQNNLSMRAAAEMLGVVSSTISELEHDNREASFETLMSLSRVTGVPIDELAIKAGREVHRSASVAERAHRAASVAEGIPPLAQLLDLMPDLLPEEADVLLSFAETLVARRKAS